MISIPGSSFLNLPAAETETRKREWEGMAFHLVEHTVGILMNFKIYLYKIHRSKLITSQELVFTFSKTNSIAFVEEERPFDVTGRKSKWGFCTAVKRGRGESKAYRFVQMACFIYFFTTLVVWVRLCIICTRERGVGGGRVPLIDQFSREVVGWTLHSLFLWMPLDCTFAWRIILLLMKPFSVGKAVARFPHRPENPSVSRDVTHSPCDWLVNIQLIFFFQLCPFHFEVGPFDQFNGILLKYNLRFYMYKSRYL